jgi:mannose-1-phosphate guanylyltransferase/mannose-6-phosphate isomerase
LIIPLILSGGDGTRLWPLSRASQPKRFLNLGSCHSLLQETLLRCRDNLFDPLAIVVGADAHRFLISQQLGDIDATADIILEPVTRSSCAAIAAGCMQALRRDPAAIVLVLAADHFIPDAASFTAAVSQGSWDAELGFLVTFGVKPDRPSTAYGYIAPDPELYGAAYRVKTFLEKPDITTAQRCIANGWLWNSGNFLIQAATFLHDLKRLAPEILAPVQSAFDGAKFDTPFLRLDGHALAATPATSVEEAVMERTARAAVIPLGEGWSEFEGWNAVSGPIGDAPVRSVNLGEGVVHGDEDKVFAPLVRLTPGSHP